MLRDTWKQTPQKKIKHHSRREIQNKFLTQENEMWHIPDNIIEIIMKGIVNTVLAFGVSLISRDVKDIVLFSILFNCWIGDWITGYRKNKLSGNLSSKNMRNGLNKTIAYLVGICTGHQIDRLIYQEYGLAGINLLGVRDFPIQRLMILIVIVIEIKSIHENLIVLGFPVIKDLKAVTKIFDVLKKIMSKK